MTRARDGSVDAIVKSIHEGFKRSEYPGDAYLQGSFEGCEPYDEVGPFKGTTDWTVLEAPFLDSHYCAPGFFSEAGFRFFIPAYMVADVRGLLQTADPTFHLTHGFSDRSHEEPQSDGTTRLRRWGKFVLVNPRRYGAMAWYDYARYRLSVFTREEATAVVSYLSWKREFDIHHEDEVRTIDAALDEFWLARSQNAPTADDPARAIEAQQR
jgi:hypothetical protein